MSPARADPRARREIELPGKFGDPDADVPSTAARPAQARFRSSVLR
ncbi:MULTISPECIES: hypothetical protein [Pseudonocardia]|nr:MULTISPECIES: hypothetical protein [Pseudonocardia]